MDSEVKVTNSIQQGKFASRLKLFMIIRGEDNTTVANAIGCKVERISNFRCCASRPTEKELAALAEHYNVPVSFMSGDSKLILLTEDRGGNQTLIYKEVI